MVEGKKEKERSNLREGRERRYGKYGPRKDGPGKEGREKKD